MHDIYVEFNAKQPKGLEKLLMSFNFKIKTRNTHQCFKDYSQPRGPTVLFDNGLSLSIYLPEDSDLSKTKSLLRIRLDQQDGHQVNLSYRLARNLLEKYNILRVLDCYTGFSISSEEIFRP